MKYALVKLDRVMAALESGLTYSVPEALKSKIGIGSLVAVPLQRRVVRGIVVAEIKEKPDFQVRDILQILDTDGPSLNQEQLNLIDWLSKRYLCTWSQALRAILPASVKSRVLRRYQLVDDYEEVLAKVEDQEELKDALFWLEQRRSPVDEGVFVNLFGRKLLNSLKDLKLIVLTEGFRGPAIREYRPLKAEKRDEKPGRGGIMLLWQRILDAGELIDEAELKTWPEYRSTYLKKMKDQGFLVYVEPEKDAQIRSKFVLTEEQEKAFRVIKDALNSSNPKPVLLHGITGSGKTELYFQAIAKVLEKGQSAIVLVPEISLTVQMVERFRRRFGEMVLLWHSALSHGERAQIWQRLKKGEKAILLGARSGIFAPVKKIGIIILDEEHESTYQQEEDPKYHTREVAIIRSREHKALLLMGSATPSITTYYLAQAGTFTLLHLSKRIGEATLPQTKIIDMREELRLGNRSIFSQALAESINLSLEKDQQVIIFHNRRGFHRMILCRSCGFVMTCPDCELPLVLHREHQQDDLRCHYCGYSISLPKNCPSCSSSYFRFFGIGTEKIVEECKKHFPDVKVMRMDADSTRVKGRQREIIEQLEKNQAAILVGTQMVAKGFDFPNVTTVGVIAADTLLFNEDPFGAERAFSLLVQVAGRAGRQEEKGRVFFQSYDPENPVLQAALKQDYVKFYQREIEYRKKLRLPPFGHLALIVAAHQDENIAETFLLNFKQKFTDKIETFPVKKARIFKVQDRYRFSLIINAPNRVILASEVSLIKEALARPDGLILSVMLDPMYL
ncbi:MAG: primosomal protein N' [Firmicutes bacterium]|jgi:primosomal protein N' (replication factor Y)|nr:primosomal protein N' [Bacillota bacterium]